MFRWLLALEVAALRQQFDELRDRVGVPEDAIATTARDLLGFRDGQAVGPGVWTLRRPV